MHFKLLQMATSEVEEWHENQVGEVLVQLVVQACEVMMQVGGLQVGGLVV